MVTRSSNLIESRIGNLAFARPRAIGGQEVELPDEQVTTLEEIWTQVDFWSQFDETITITSTAQDITLPSVTVSGLPTGAVVERAIALARFRMVSNTDCCDNEINSPGTSLAARVDGAVDAIILTDGMLFTPGSGHSDGVEWVGDQDIKAEVDGDGTYSFSFDDAEVLADSLLVRDIQVGLRIWYTVPDDG